MSGWEPRITAICCTYGRWWHLEEAVESFLRQDYDGNAELLIVNDMPDQVLEMGELLSHHPNKRIRVVNLAERMVPNNLKFDYGVQEARGAICCFWDDDDISLPNRLRLADAYFLKMPELNYWSMPWRWHLDAEKMPALINCGLHGGDAFRREAYLNVGGSVGDGHNDQVAMARMKNHPGYLEAGKAADCFYVYRWGGITAHHSAYGASVADCMARFDRVVRSDSRFRTGRIVLRPHYLKNYESLCKQAYNQHQENTPA